MNMFLQSKEINREISEIVEIFIELIKKNNLGEVNNTQINVFTELCIDSEIPYDQIAQKINKSDGTVRAVARDIYAILNKAINIEGSIGKRNFKSLAIPALLKYRKPQTKLNSKNSQVKLAKSNQKTHSTPPNNGLYVKRINEDQCIEIISNPAGLIKIQGLEKSGKSLLIQSILRQLRDSTHGVTINLALAGDRNLDDLDRFCLWLCRFTTKKLGIELPSDSEWEYLWDEDLGGKSNAEMYFNEYLLKAIDRPLILAFDNLRYLFRHEKVAQEVLQLFRFWNDPANNIDTEIGKKLRLILSYRENIVSLEGEGSPLNIGFNIRLNEFNIEEIIQLSSKYGLSWKEEDAQNLLEKTNGKVNLVDSFFKQLVEKN